MTIDELIEKLDADRTQHWTHEIGAPLDDAELAAWHAEHGLTIPDDLLAVLRRANGIRFNVDASGRSTLGKDLLPLRYWKPAHIAWGREPNNYLRPTYLALTSDTFEREYLILDAATGAHFTMLRSSSRVDEADTDLGNLLTTVWTRCVGAGECPDARNGSRLFYAGSQEELRLGDRVRRKRWLRRPIEGVVAFLPGCGPRHPDLHDDIGATWLIRWREGYFTSAFYSPESNPLKQDLELVSRGTVEPIPVTERIA